MICVTQCHNTLTSNMYIVYISNEYKLAQCRSVVILKLVTLLFMTVNYLKCLLFPGLFVIFISNLYLPFSIYVCSKTFFLNDFKLFFSNSNGDHNTV